MARLRTVAVLTLAMAGPSVLAFVCGRMLGDAPTVAMRLPGDLAEWAILATVLGIVVFVERQPLASIGLRRPRLSSLGWALLLLLTVNFVLAPALMALTARLGVGGFAPGFAQLARIPAWYRVFLAVSAGMIEEPLYRGYAVERLAWLTGSYPIAGTIAAIVFAVAHFPAWQWNLGPVLVAFAGGAVATAFYIWKRDLTPLIIAHAVGDTIGLVLLPPLS
jgi:membrane protease YdiL (CAAX protease family)